MLWFDPTNGNEQTGSPTSGGAFRTLPSPFTGDSVLLLSGTVFGDIDLDGDFDLGDLNSLIDNILMRAPMPASGSPEFINGDVNADNQLDAMDGNLFVDRLLGRIARFPAEP